MGRLREMTESKPNITEKKDQKRNRYKKKKDSSEKEGKRQPKGKATNNLVW